MGANTKATKNRNPMCAYGVHVNSRAIYMCVHASVFFFIFMNTHVPVNPFENLVCFVQYNKQCNIKQYNVIK